MRVSLSRQFFAFFFAFVLVTGVMGGTVYLSLSELDQSFRNVHHLSEFSLQVKDLEALNAGFSVNTADEQQERLTRTLDKAESLVHQLLEFKERLSPGLRPLAVDLEKYLHYYRSAGNEMLKKSAEEKRFDLASRALFRQMQEVTAGMHGEEAVLVLRLFVRMETLVDEIRSGGDMEKLGLIRQLGDDLATVTADPLTRSIGRQLVAAVEQKYLAQLAIKEANGFLVKTSQRFLEIVGDAIDQLQEESQALQERLRFRIVLMVLFSLLLAVVFWWFMTKRLSRFLAGMNSAIRQIREGNYDYPLPALTEDELGDLVVFLKDLAQSLKREIRERARTEEERKQLQVQLFQSQRLESVGLLAGGVAHDFNNILTSIIGYSELAIAKQDLDSQSRRYLEIILQSGRRAAKLTRQLLAFSRNQAMEIRLLDLNQLITDLVRMLDRLLGDEIILELALSEQTGAIKADPTQIEQVLMNLAVNARDAMPGGGRLTIATEEVEIGEDAGVQVNGLPPGRYVRLTVRDTGEGMNEEIRARIFDPFFTTKERGKGTGLGLSMVYGIVEKHGGHIGVESSPGKGSAFVVHFPLCQENACDEIANETEMAARGRERILVVDDDLTVRVFLKDCLEEHGYRVTCAENGVDALDRIIEVEGVVDLVLTDATMPVMGGVELISQIRKQWPEIRTIMLSGHVEQPEGVGDILGQSVIFVQKPVVPAHLLVILRRELDRSG